MLHNIALIGAGDIVRKAYLPELTGRVDCRVKALCSKGGASAEELAQQYGIPAWSKEYREIIKEKDIDVVFVCTPTNSHRLIAEAALDAGKHILVEKPLCTNYTDSNALLQRAVRSDKVLYPAFNNSFREENLFFFHKVERGELGCPEVIDFEWYRTRRYETKAWLYDARQSGGGVLIDLGAHLVHMALGLLPDRKKFCVNAVNMHHSSEDSSVEDTSTATIIIDDQTSILIKTGWDVAMPERSRVNLNVIGSKGVASNRDYQGPKSEGYPAMLEDCFRHIEENRKPDLQRVDDTMLVLEAMYESNRKKTCITGVFNRLT